MRSHALLPITVIIPVYKSDFLAETLRSVVNQTLKPERVLVLEDGCPRRTGDLALPFAPLVELIRKPNSGVSDTRNLGLSMTTSEWVSFMDHDDIWEPDHLAQQAAALAANPQADVVYSGRRHLVQQTDGTFALSAPLQLPFGNTVGDIIMDRPPFNPSAVLVRRSRALSLGGFNSRFNGVEDWDFWLRLWHAGAGFVHSPKPTLHYRVHNASNTNNPLPIMATTIDVVHRSVLPYVPVYRRPFVRARLTSRSEAQAAILLRQNGMPGARRLLIRSLFHHPFHFARRYGILAHMLFFGYQRAS